MNEQLIDCIIAETAHWQLERGRIGAVYGRYGGYLAVEPHNALEWDELGSVAV